MSGVCEKRAAMGTQMDGRAIIGVVLSPTESELCWGRYCDGDALPIQLHVPFAGAIGSFASAITSGWAQRSLHGGRATRTRIAT